MRMAMDRQTMARCRQLRKTSGRVRRACRQAHADGLYEFVRHDRLAEYARDVEASGLQRRSGDDNDGNVPRDGARREFLLDREAIERAQNEIEYDKVRRPVFDEPQCLDAI